MEGVGRPRLVLEASGDRKDPMTFDEFDREANVDTGEDITKVGALTDDNDDVAGNV